MADLAGLSTLCGARKRRLLDQLNLSLRGKRPRDSDNKQNERHRDEAKSPRGSQRREYERKSAIGEPVVAIVHWNRATVANCLQTIEYGKGCSNTDSGDSDQLTIGQELLLMRCI